MTTFYFLRHGELDQKGVLAGHTDFLLSDKGLQQMTEQLSKQVGFDICYSSPLKRCAIVAQQYCKQNNITCIEDRRLMEMDFGSWDGKAYDLLWSDCEQIADYKLGDFWQDPWEYSPPNGETMEAFTLRVEEWWNKVVDLAFKSQHQNVLVVSHGGVIKYLLANVMGISVKPASYLSSLEVSYASIAKVQVYFDEQKKAWSKFVL